VSAEPPHPYRYVLVVVQMCGFRQIDSVGSMSKMRISTLVALCIFLNSCATGQGQDDNADQVAFLEQQIVELESEVAKLTSTSTPPVTCATGGSCKLGDTGPGGGLIFFIDREDDYAGFTYIEISQSDVSSATGDLGIFQFCNWIMFGNLEEGSNEIGRGPINSKQISDGSCKTDPASRALDFEVNSWSDWYLPTVDELLLVYDVLVRNGYGNFEHVGQNAPVEYCTSSSNSDATYLVSNPQDLGPAFVMMDPSFLGSGNAVDRKFSTNCIVRPVRAFG